MSQPYPPPPSSPYAAPRPTKPRPKRRWWVVGVLLLVAAVVVFGVGLWQTLAGATRTEAVVDATSGAVEVDLPADEELMLYAPQDAPVPGCRLTDGSGEELPLESSRVSTTVTTEGRTWTGLGTFTSTSGTVTLDCSGSAPGTPVRIGPPLGTGFVGGLLVTLLVPLVLGAAGVAVLVTTAVLWFTRAPRTPGAGQVPGQPPAPGSPPPPGW